MYTQSPHPLIDALIADGVARNDATLCKLLCLQPAHMSKIRHGHIPVSDSMRVAILRKTKWTLKQIDALAPPEA